jgi:FtsP/CotA-like multicopper oxidase with cupredoxin domain
MRFTRRHLLGSLPAMFLPFPAHAAGSSGTEGPRVLTAAQDAVALLRAPAAKTTICGFDGRMPGPLLRYKKGDEIKLRLENKLAEPVTFCCDGMRLPNAMAGVGGLTQAPIAQGQSFAYQFTPPDSGLYWYRSCVPPRFESQIDRGLFGPLIVDEAEPPLVDHDIALVIADWGLDADAQIDEAKDAPQLDPGADNGHYVVTVGSDPAPMQRDVVPGARLRLRLLSVIQSQLIFVSFIGLKPMVLAIDGQPCEAFAPLRQTLPIGPGACFDVICDAPDHAGMHAAIVWRTGARNDRPLVFFNTSGARRLKLPPMASLPANPLLPSGIKLQAARRADLIIETMPDKSTDKPSILPPGRHGPLLLNGKPAQEFPPTPLFSIKRGSPVTLGFINRTAILMQVHVHGHAMRLLHDRDDSWEPYWRSRVVVPEAHIKHVAFLADTPGKWAIECQSLELEPHWLVNWFEVT